MDPGIEPVRIAEARQVTPGDHQRVLQGILGPVDIPKDPVRDREQAVATRTTRSMKADWSPCCAASTRSRSTPNRSGRPSGTPSDTLGGRDRPSVGNLLACAGVVRVSTPSTRPRMGPSRHRRCHGVRRRRHEAARRPAVRGRWRGPRGHRTDRETRAADALGRLQPRPATGRRHGSRTPARGRPDLRRGGGRARLRSLDQRVRGAVHPVRERVDLPPPLPGTGQGDGRRFGDRVAGAVLVGGHRRHDAEHHGWPP